jgi:hypothetical protein
MHYMQFPHSTLGLTRANFTYYVFKNGELSLETAVEVRECPSGVYTLSFVNDGTHESFWSLIAWESANTDVKYGESWMVRDDSVRRAVFEIQSDIQTGANGAGGGGVGGSPGPAIGRG